MPPLERHPALVSLSRDHHGALQLAQGLVPGGPEGLKRRLPADPAARADHVRAFFAAELAPHFRAEEEVLFPVLAERSPALAALCRRLQGDHARLRALVAAGDDLEGLGALLEAHVRAEERELFPQAQDALPEATLAARRPNRSTRRVRPRRPPVMRSLPPRARASGIIRHNSLVEVGP